MPSLRRPPSRSIRPEESAVRVWHMRAPGPERGAAADGAVKVVELVEAVAEEEKSSCSRRDQLQGGVKGVRVRECEMLQECEQ